MNSNLIRGWAPLANHPVWEILRNPKLVKLLAKLIERMTGVIVLAILVTWILIVPIVEDVWNFFH